MMLLDWCIQTWEVFVAGALSIAAVLGALAAIWTQTKKGREWMRVRRKRKEAINKLADNVEKLFYSDKLQQRHEAQLVEMAGKLADLGSEVKGLNSILKITIKHNERQDAEILDSLKERKIYMQAQLGILDWIITQGGNGTAHEARNCIRKYQTEMAHRARKELKI